MIIKLAADLLPSDFVDGAWFDANDNLVDTLADATQVCRIIGGNPTLQPIAQSAPITSPDGNTFVQVVDGQVNFTVDNQPVGSMSFDSGMGMGKLTWPGVIDPASTQLIPLTIAQRDALVANLPLAKRGYVCYVVDTGVNELQLFNGASWQSVGSGASVTVVDALTSNSATSALSANQGQVLNASVAAEVTRATAAEVALGNRATALETSQATQDTAIAAAATTTALTAEVTRATAAETALATRATALETSQATQDTAIATNTTAIATETTRATAAEVALANRATALETSQATQDTAIAAKAATTYVDTQDAATLTAANTYTNTQVSALLGGAPAAALDTIAELATALTDEQSATAAFTTALANETTRATNAETALGNRATALETSQATQDLAIAAKADTSYVDSQDLTNANAIAAETTRATAAEVALGNRATALETSQAAQDTAIAARATPADITTAIAAHTAAADPHTAYQLESEKGVANGYASLGPDGRLPNAQSPDVASTRGFLATGTSPLTPALPADGVQMGNIGGSPRIGLQNGSSRWEVDNLGGSLRFFTNSIVPVSFTQSSASLNVPTTVNSVTSNGLVNLSGTAAPLLLNGQPGTPGQVPTSAGPGATPTWGTPATAPSAWAASTLVLANEFKTSTINAVPVVIRNGPTDRTTGTTFDLTEAGNWTVVSQANDVNWIASTVFPAGLRVLRSGVGFFRVTTAYTTAADFDADWTANIITGPANFTRISNDTRTLRNADVAVPFQGLLYGGMNIDFVQTTAGHTRTLFAPTNANSSLLAPRTAVYRNVGTVSMNLALNAVGAEMVTLAPGQQRTVGWNGTSLFDADVVNHSTQTLTATGSVTRWNSTVTVNSSTAATITLPDAGTVDIGAEITILNIGSGAVTVFPGGADSLGGTNLLAQNASVTYRVTEANIVRAVSDIEPSMTDTPLARGTVLGITDLQTTSSVTFVDVLGGAIPLPGPGVYTIRYTVGVSAATQDAHYMRIVNAAGVEVPGSIGFVQTSVSGFRYQVVGEGQVTIAAAETYRLQRRVSGGTQTIYNATGTGPNSGNSTITWEQEPNSTRANPGTVPVTPLSSIKVNRTTNQSLPTNTDVLFNFTEATKGTNITYNPATGVFTLQPGFEYECEANLAHEGTGGAGASDYSWRDVATGLNVGTSGLSIAPNTNSNFGTGGPAKFTVTPTSVMSLTVRSTTGSLAVARANYTYAQIEQKPTTTVVNTGTVPILAANHATGRRSTIQAVTTAASEAAPQFVIFDQITVLSGSPSLNTTTGEITLPAGIYRIEGGVGNADGGRVMCRWFVGGVPGGSVGGVTAPFNGASNAQASGAAVHEFTISAPTVVRLAVIGVAINANIGFQTDSPTAAPWFVIHQLHAATVVDPGMVQLATPTQLATAATGNYIDAQRLRAAGQIPPTLTPNTVATTETVVARFAIPANTFKTLENYLLEMFGQVSSTASLTFRIRFGTTGGIADALVIAFTISAAGGANGHHSLRSLISIPTATTMTAGGSSQLVATLVGPATGAFAPATVDLSVANFLSVTLVQSLAQTYTPRGAKLTL